MRRMTVQITPNGVRDVFRRRVLVAYGAAARLAVHRRFAVEAVVYRVTLERMFRATAVNLTNAAGQRRSVQITGRQAANKLAVAVFGVRRPPVKAAIRATVPEQTAVCA